MTQCLSANCARPVPPRTVRELSERSPYLFVPMHMTTSITALEAASLPTTGELLAQSGRRLLGDPTKIVSRLNTDLPHPFSGKLADYTPFSFTPRTLAAIGSCEIGRAHV